MVSSEESACLLISEGSFLRDSLDLAQVPAGAALIVRQPGESNAQVLQRAALRARELRDCGYAIASGSLVLGASDLSTLNDRESMAYGLLALLETPDAPLHLVAADDGDQLSPFLLAEKLTREGSRHPIQVHFQRRSEPKGPSGRYITTSSCSADRSRFRVGNR